MPSFDTIIIVIIHRVFRSNDPSKAFANAGKRRLKVVGIRRRIVGIEGNVFKDCRAQEHDGRQAHQAGPWRAQVRDRG